MPTDNPSQVTFMCEVTKLVGSRAAMKEVVEMFVQMLQKAVGVEDCSSEGVEGVLLQFVGISACNTLVASLHS